MSMEKVITISSLLKKIEKMFEGICLGETMYTIENDASIASSAMKEVQIYLSQGDSKTIYVSCDGVPFYPLYDGVQSVYFDKDKAKEGAMGRKEEIKRFKRIQELKKKITEADLKKLGYL